MHNCVRCGSKAFIKRPKTGDVLCRECFLWCFEEEVHWTIKTAKLLSRGDKVAIGASGGKDSTVLAYVMKLLNERHSYGVQLILLSIDEGISGYRDDSLETVKRNKEEYGLPLVICSYKDLYGWSMDEIVKKIGPNNNCTFCGVFRRQALDRGAAILGATKICTGHNADDIAETVVMNILRCDIGRLKRCTDIVTGADGSLPRFKPFKYAYEKEIVLYARARRLHYFSTECKYAPNGYRGHARAYIKDLERLRPRSILDIIYSGEQMVVRSDVKVPMQGTCVACGYISSQKYCRACILLKRLNDGLPGVTITTVGDAVRPRRAKVDSETADSSSKPHEATAELRSSASTNPWTQSKLVAGNGALFNSSVSYRNSVRSIDSHCTGKVALDCNLVCFFQSSSSIKTPSDSFDDFEGSSLFPQWPDLTTDESGPMNSLFKPFQTKSHDQTKLSDDSMPCSVLQDKPLGGALASGDASFRHLQ